MSGSFVASVISRFRPGVPAPRKWVLDRYDRVPEETICAHVAREFASESLIHQYWIVEWGLVRVRLLNDQ